ARKPESEILAISDAVRPEHVHRALDQVETRAGEFDAATKDTVKAFEALDTCVEEAADRLQPLYAAARSVEEALDDLPSGPEAGRGGAHRARDAVVRAAGQVTALMAELMRDVKIARHEYNERRYESDARYNQMIAGLYEIRVRLSSRSADAHRTRSKFFF